MKLSIFTPIGLLRCSKRTPLAKSRYEQARAGLGGQFDMSAGSAVEAYIYANAIGQAKAQRRVESAAYQRIPHRASHLMPTREREWGIIPAADASMQARREEYARRFRAIQSTNLVSVEAALSELLGDDFVAYRTTPTAEIVGLSQADGLDINYQAPGVERKAIIIDDAISFIGVPTQFDFTDVANVSDPLRGGSIVAGDVLMVEPGRLGLSERVVVTSITTHEPKKITATFQRPHSAGVYAVTHPYPGESTTKRHSIVVLADSAAALDPETRRAIDQLLRLYTRSVSTWSIAAADGSDILQFQIGSPSLGISTIESFPIVP